MAALLLNAAETALADPEAKAVATGKLVRLKPCPVAAAEEDAEEAAEAAAEEAPIKLGLPKMPKVLLPGAVLLVPAGTVTQDSRITISIFAFFRFTSLCLCCVFLFRHHFLTVCCCFVQAFSVTPVMPGQSSYTDPVLSLSRHKQS